MRQIFTLTLVLFSLTFFAQTNVLLRLEHTMNGEPLQFNQEYSEPDLGYDFNITRLEYYISEIAIQHDGGQVTEIEETWLLVDAKNQMDYALGSHNITDVEGITFHIGVDPEHNHLDPTTYPSGHPLAPQNPSMHWGWASGYRFVCLEGFTGIGLLFVYQIHALGDANYMQSSVATSAVWEGDDLVIALQADYMGMYQGIDVSTGLIEHSEVGAAETLLHNFSDNVFSQILFTGISEAGKQSFQAYPNPTYSGKASISLVWPQSSSGHLTVTDMTGRQIVSKPIQGAHKQQLSFGEAGIYFVQLWHNGQLVQSEKLVVAQ